jgi:hypothetical protein
MDVRTYQSKTTSVISNIFTKQGLMSKAIQSPLTDHFLANHERLDNIRIPFSPDIIVYCKSNYLFLEHGLVAAEIAERIGIFKDRHAYYPKIIIEQDGGLIAVEESEKSLETVLEVYLDLMKISYLSEQFGGPHPMTPEQIQFIDNWEVENYRRSVAKS